MGQIDAFIVGQAQRSDHEAEAVDHPLTLMIDIANRALSDAGIPAAELDAIACVDPFSWTYTDLTKAVGDGLGCSGTPREIWLPAGGTTPQDLLHEIARAMRDGDVDVALIVGAEAMRTRRKASRTGRELPWPARDKSVKPTRGQKPFTSEWEARHGLRLPIQTFPLNENALRAAHGRSAEAQVEIAARLLHKNALVAASNPHAWFRDAPSVAEIATETADNRMIAYPYTKRMNAIMDVDQAAALVVVSERRLAQSGDRRRAAAVLGGAGAEEVWNPIERPDLARSEPMRVAFSWALEAAGLNAGDIDAFDLYSCFPAPIQMALEALDIPLDDPRPFSLTGGLAYAGGPGNNYVTHSLATAVERLRAHPEQTLMVTGVGMANTKHSATLLGSAAHVPEAASGDTIYRLETGETALPVAQRATGPCDVVSYTIEYDRDAQPSQVIYVLEMLDGSRAIANARDPVSAASTIRGQDPIGQRGMLSWDDGLERQFFA